MNLKQTRMCLLMMAAIISISNGKTSEMGVQTPSDIRKETQVFTRLNKVIDLGEKTLDSVKKISSVVGGVGTAFTSLDTFIKTIQGEETSTNEILKQQHNEVMQKLAEISTQISEVQHAVDRGFQKLTHDTAKSIQTNTPFYILSVELSRYVESIDNQYRDSQYLNDFLKNKTTSRTLIQEAMDNFVRQVFELNPTTNILRNIHSAIYKQESSEIVSSYLNLFAEHAMSEYSIRCNTFESPNQQLYQIYFKLLITELKAIDVLSHGYKIRSILRNATYSYDIERVKREFRSRVTDYRDAIKAALPYIAKDVRRCHVAANDKSVYQLEGYIRFVVESEFEISQRNDCVDTCPEINIGTRSRENPMKMDPVEVCPAPDNSGRKYDWIRTADKDEKIYGRMKNCKKQVQILKGAKLGSCCRNWWYGPLAFQRCDICGYTKITTFHISTTEKLSNINSNMVITSVRLAIVNGAVEFQITQGQLTPEGKVNIIPAAKSATIQSNVQRDEFDFNKRHMYLDDVIVDPGYAVTGLRFKLAREGDSFKINVRGTKYNYATGRLDTSDSKWFDPEDPRQSSTNPNYRRDREIISFDNVDNPIHTDFFTPLATTNQKVRFNNTSVLKDAGQVTIPLLDGQEVYMSRPIVITGVGLYYMDSPGHGGFIAPRIFTESFHEYIN